MKESIPIHFFSAWFQHKLSELLSTEFNSIRECVLVIQTQISQFKVPIQQIRGAPGVTYTHLQKAQKLFDQFDSLILSVDFDVSEVFLLPDSDMCNEFTIKLRQKLKYLDELCSNKSILPSKHKIWILLFQTLKGLISSTLSHLDRFDSEVRNCITFTHYIYELKSHFHVPLSRVLQNTSRVESTVDSDSRSELEKQIELRLSSLFILSQQRSLAFEDGWSHLCPLLQPYLPLISLGKIEEKRELLSSFSQDRETLLAISQVLECERKNQTESEETLGQLLEKPDLFSLLLEWKLANNKQVDPLDSVSSIKPISPEMIQMKHLCEQYALSELGLEVTVVVPPNLR